MKRTEKLTELKRELEALSPPELLKIVLRLAKHKVENKELLSYLLYGWLPMDYPLFDLQGHRRRLGELAGHSRRPTWLVAS